MMVKKNRKTAIQKAIQRFETSLAIKRYNKNKVKKRK